MPRAPTPKYRPDRRCWIVQVGGTQHVLARRDDYRTDKQAEAAAWVEFHRLMAEHHARAAPVRAPTLAAVAAKYIADLKARRDRGEVCQRLPSDYHGRIDGLVRMFGDRQADRVGAAELDEFLASRPSWGMNRRADSMRAIVTMYRWAKRRKLIACDPPEPHRAMPRKLRRDRLPTWEEVQAILGAIPEGEEFKDFASFIAWTGCRPSEAARLEAKHLGDGVATLLEHKTRKKTGKTRVIVMPGPAREIVARRAEQRPEGPLFRSPSGAAWTRDTWKWPFRRARAAAGADPRLTLYTFRHGRATALLLRGVPLAKVAALLGNTAAIVDRTYSDVIGQMDDLRRVAEEGVEGPGSG